MAGVSELPCNQSDQRADGL